MSNSLGPHGLQLTSLLCSPLPLGVCSNSCPSLFNQWCYFTISFSADPFSSFLQSFPASGCFLMSQFFASGSQSMLQHQSFQWIFRIDFFRIDWFDVLAVQGTLQSLLQHHSPKASILLHSAFSIVQLSYPYMTTGPLLRVIVDSSKKYKIPTWSLKLWLALWN